MYNLSDMTLDDWMDCGAALSKAGDGAASMQEAAQRIVQYLYDSLGSEAADGAAGRACVLARLYKTHPYRSLPPRLMDFVDIALGGNPSQDSSLKCLTLLGSAGDEPEWKSPRLSRGHQAIPLLSEELVAERIPMVARLVEQFGVGTGALLSSDPSLMLEKESQWQGVFYVPAALGSPYIPAQDNFVKPYGVRSVVGFGGVLPSGDLFAVILFTRVPVTRQSAESFGGLALSLKISLLPFTFQRIFLLD